MPYRKSKITPIKPVLDAVSQVVDRSLAKGAKTFAESARDQFKKRIEGQLFKSFHEYPLSPDYVDFKRRRGLDLRTMIATGNYLKHIAVHKDKTEEGTVGYFVGFRKTDMAVDADGNAVPDLPLWILALIHERGAQGLAPRAHWQPMLQILKKQIPEAAKDIHRNVTKGLRKV